MAVERRLIPLEWRRSLGLGRVALALSCLILQGLSRTPAGALIQALLILFLLYAVVAMLWKSLQRPAYAMLSLVLDTIFFLICATSAGALGSWLSAAFYIYLLLVTVLTFQWQQVLVIASVAVGFFLLTRPPNWELLSPAMFLMALLAFLFSLQKAVLEDRLFHASRQSVLFRAEAEKAREAERQRIAADFHDGPLQSFVSIQMRLEVVRKLIESNREAALEELIQLQTLWKSQVGELRAFVRSMRPVEVDSAGLTASVSRMVETFQKDTGISTTFLGGGTLEQGPEVAIEVLQIVREALHNVRKHSGATRVAVAVGTANGNLQISVEDNGSGFAFSGKYSLEELELLRLGPGSIKRRVRALGGDLTIESRPGHGVGMKIDIPA